MCIGGPFTPLLVLASLLGASSALLSDVEAAVITRRQMALLPKGWDYEPELKEGDFPNRRLRDAYIALQAWKKAMNSDPYGVTENWVRPNVCDYKGVFCEQALDDPSQTIVAGIDLNHADISGYIPAEFGLLVDVALLHLNSNRFRGLIPGTFANLRLLHEDLDALFLNNNKFTKIPDNFGESPVSVVVLAHNNIRGHIPRSTGNMSRTLNEIIFSHNKMSGNIPGEIGRLKELRVLDISSNSFTGSLPKSMRNLRSLEHFDISGNRLKGSIPRGICDLPKLNYFVFGRNPFQDPSEGCGPSERKRGASRHSAKCSKGSCQRVPRKIHHERSIPVPKSHPPAPAPAPTPTPTPNPTATKGCRRTADVLTTSLWRGMAPSCTCKSLFHLMLFRCAGA
ncbi:hypothetical protein MLD38_034439 [Melastoma candidum]|uniref:Uncharacterized protein n=1 Tax=Melastoma candidum TaxID=119954 RepID=A0ACB9MBB0_9MYRT|nr:hypothetical protein MLD38_034439 [Melastoma candidum]